MTESKILKDIENFTASIHDLKYLQKNFASAIANITEQYYLLVSAQQTYEFLKNNDSVTLGLNHLQEVLVSAGILNPYELDDAENLANLEKLMQRAEKTFTNIVSAYFPYVNSPIVDSFYEISKEYSQALLPEIEKPLVPNANAVNAEVMGNITIALGRIIHIEKGDAKEDDYPNLAWKIRSKPSSHEHEKKGLLHIELPYTKIWVESKKFLQEMLPVLKEVSKDADMVSACNLLHGLGICHIADMELLDILSSRILKFQERVDIDLLANAIYGLGMANSHPDTAKVLVNLLGNHPDLKEIGFNSLIKCIWGQCVHQLYENPEMPKFLKLLNNFEVLDLTKNENEIFKEVMMSVDIHLKPLLPEINLALLLAKAHAMNPAISNHMKGYFNPLKPLLTKTGRFIMSQGITDEEARIIHKKILATDKFPIFPCDDVIALSGFKTLVFYVGDDGVYENHLLGNYQLKLRHLESLGMRGLPIPMYQILNVDPVDAKISFKSTEPINDFVRRYVGIPKNHLEKLDLFVSDLLILMRDDYTEIANDTQAMLFLEEILGAYKIQSVSRTKSGKYIHRQALEEIKLQFYKLFNRFQILKENSKKLINELVQQNTPEKTFPDLIKKFNDEIVLEKAEPLDFWNGCRQRMQIPTNKADADITDEIINQRFLMLSDYFQYYDWAKQINTSYPLHSDMSLYEDELFNNFFFIHRRQQIGMLPDPLQKINSLKEKISLDTQIKVFLSNVKYEIKRNFSDKEIIDKVLNLDIIDKLIKDHLEPCLSYPKYIERDPAYFTKFIEDQIKITEDNDQYVKFYRQVYGQEEVKKELIEKFVKNMKAVNRKKELRTIEKLQYHREMIKKYTNTKEALEMNDPERDIYMDPIFRQSFGYKTDPRTLRPRKESIRDDIDFLKFDFDDDYLDFKRRKAESNLIKLRIFLKIHKNQELSQLEKEYLDHYKHSLKAATLNDAGAVYIPSATTCLTFRDLSESDKSFFSSLRKADMPKGIEEYSLNELLFELGHFFDDYLIKRIECNAIENKELQEWGISPDPTGYSKLKPLWGNKGLWVQNSSMEEYI